MNTNDGVNNDLALPCFEREAKKQFRLVTPLIRNINSHIDHNEITVAYLGI